MANSSKMAANPHPVLVTTTAAMRCEIRQRVVELRQMLDVELDPSGDLYRKLRDMLELMAELFGDPGGPHELDLPER